MIGISFHSGGMVDKPLSWVIRHLGEIGYDAIEIVCGPRAHIKPDEVTESHLQAIRDELAAAGLRCAAVNPYTVKSLAEFERDGGAQEFFRQLIDLAQFFQAPVANFLPGRLPSSDTDGWRTLVQALKPLLHYARDKGVAMAIHNHENHILDTPDKVRLIIQEVGMDNLVSLCDITNFWILGSDVEWAVRRLGPSIRHCHVKGVVGKFPYNHFLVPGEREDQFPFREFAQALGAIGYQGCVSVETFSHMREDKARVAYEMMSRHLAELGLREA